MRQLDAHYTPPAIAESLAEIASDGMREPLAVVDLAAGEGALLRAVLKIADCRSVGAADIDGNAVALMRFRFPEWTVAQCDSLSSRSIANSNLVRGGREWDVAVLNPPFSCRGRKTYGVEYEGEAVGTSLALAFVMAGLRLTTAAGRVVALLPQGSQQSTKDARGWDLIRSSCSVNVSLAFPRGSFPWATAATEVVTISKTGVQRLMNGSSIVVPNTRVPSIACRGWVKMHERVADQSGSPLVHTTDLAHLDSGDLELVSTKRTISGPAVLLPRVGKPDEMKVVVLPGGTDHAISDCVFHIGVPSLEAAHTLRKQIIGQWDQFCELHIGPCAPHITKVRLDRFLLELKATGSTE